MHDRRKFERIPENSEISYEVTPDPKTEHFVTKDISGGGIRFFVHEFIPENSILKIRLTLRKISLSFETFVKVVWITEDHINERYEVGVEFLEVPKDVALHLIDYIKFIKDALEQGNNP